MKKCPYCTADNRDDAQVCYHCGRGLRTWTPPPIEDEVDPTQPVHTRPYPPQPFDTQPRPYPRPAANPTAGDTATYRPRSQSYSQPTYPQSYAQPVYAPPPPPAPPAANRGSSQLWPVFIIALAFVFLCVGGLAVWTITTATTGGLNRLGAQMSTQVAGVFVGSPVQATPTEQALPAEPTSWPTFTPAPTEPPAPTDPPASTNQATNEPAVEKLLSPECAGALNHLEDLSNQVSTQPTAPLDAAWRKDLSQSISAMKTRCGSLDAASPVPQQLNAAHLNLSHANDEFDQATKLFNEGVEKLDPGKIFEAGPHVQQAAHYLSLGISELKKIGQ